MFFDFYYLILVVPALLLALYAQLKVKTTYSKYSRKNNVAGITGAQAARRVLDSNGLNFVRVERISGELTDHFDPRTNVVSLSEKVYDTASIASVGIACHEVGHAIQHAKEYTPIKLRNAILPVTQVASSLAVPLIFLGIILNFLGLVYVGIICFSAAVVFQLITLPVEFNASSRALASIDECGFLAENERKDAKKVLSSAAMTYVAALIVSLMQLLRFVMIARDR